MDNTAHCEWLLLLLLFFLFTALFARYCTFKIVFSYSAIQSQVCLINSVFYNGSWLSSHQNCRV